MNRESIYLDFNCMTKRMKRAFLVAADICKKERYSTYMCNTVNREHAYSSKFKEFVNIKLKCPPESCEACPGAPYNIKHYVDMWTNGPLKEKRTPKKKDKTAFKLLKKLRS